MKKFDNRKRLKYFPFLVKGFFEYHIPKRLKPLLPRELMLVLDYRCDARCLMCDIWRINSKNELSGDQIKNILSDKLFSKVQTINLTGGEPTLRNDLSQIARIVIDTLPKLKKVTMSTTGLTTKRVVAFCTQIAENCNQNGIDFLVDISLDGIGTVHDKIRNVPRAFEKVNNTLSELKALNKRLDFRFGVNCTISKENLHDVRNVRRWCQDNDVTVNFFVATFTENYFSNIELKGKLSVAEGNENDGLVTFLEELGTEKSLFNLPAYYYRDVANMMKNGHQRTVPCVFQSEACILDSYGDLYFCMHGKKIGNCLQGRPYDIYFGNLNYRDQILLTEKCPGCNQACFLETGIAKEAIGYTKFLLSPQ